MTHARERRLAERLLTEFSVDLRGLRILTEAGSGHYLTTPLLAALAGAQHVDAFVRDTPHGSAAHVAEEAAAVAAAWGVADRVRLHTTMSDDAITRADIVTNTGMLRPLDRRFIAAMKQTAVIPLMWETWEFRAADLDLEACREKGVLVMGTNERAPECGFLPFTGLLGVEMMRRLGLEVAGNEVLMLGAQAAIGGVIADTLRRLSCRVTQFGAPAASDDHMSARGEVDGRNLHRYETLADHFRREGGRYDALLLCEHADARCLLGANALLPIEDIVAVNPSLALGHIAGTIDAAAIRAAGLRLVPEQIAPFGHMSLHAGHFGPLPALRLFAAGLKVGEMMARARLAGLAIEDAARAALKNPLVMDFPPPHAWVRT